MTARSINPDHEIALRGPLSQFFSGIYLKRLDDAFAKMGVTYFRYQDDILILCQTNRQHTRCRWVMWWLRTSESWQYQELLEWFLNVCWDCSPASIAAGLIQRAINVIAQDATMVLPTSGFHATA